MMLQIVKQYASQRNVKSNFIFLTALCRWWAPSKFDPVKSPMLFFEKGKPIMPPIAPDVGLDLVLKHMVIY